MLWGKVEMKNEEKVFKLTLLELEPDKNNITDPELINYTRFLNEKFILKTEEEEPEQEIRENENKEIE